MSGDKPAGFLYQTGKVKSFHTLNFQDLTVKYIISAG